MSNNKIKYLINKRDEFISLSSTDIFRYSRMTHLREATKYYLIITINYAYHEVSINNEIVFLLFYLFLILVNLFYV